VYKFLNLFLTSFPGYCFPVAILLRNYLCANRFRSIYFVDKIVRSLVFIGVGVSLWPLAKVQGKLAAIEWIALVLACAFSDFVSIISAVD
jgi:hypothetical protein